MDKKSQHIVPNISGGWSVKKSGSTRATKNFDGKEEAIKFGQKIAAKQNTELIIHKKDGRIQAKAGYSREINQKKDRKH